MHVRTAVAALILISSLPGCTAVLSTIKVVSADHAVREVDSRGANELAPYEYTLARRYAAKAIQESGDGENRTAIDLAKIAVVYADAANRKMAGGGRGMEEMQRESADPLMEEEAPSGAQPVRPEPPPEPVKPADDEGDDDDFLKEDDEENAP